MDSNKLLAHLRPETLATIISQLYDDHFITGIGGKWDFDTDDAKEAYATLLAAGRQNCGDEMFRRMVDEAIDREPIAK